MKRNEKYEIEQTANECSICSSLQEAATALLRIVSHIEMSCLGTGKKKDFGLEKSFIESQVKVIRRMFKFHQYYHATGESLNDGDFGFGMAEKPPIDQKNFKFKKFRKHNDTTEN